MINDDLLELRKSLETAFVDRMTDSNLAMKPRFLSVMDPEEYRSYDNEDYRNSQIQKQTRSSSFIIQIISLLTTDVR